MSESSPEESRPITRLVVILAALVGVICLVAVVGIGLVVRQQARAMGLNVPLIAAAPTSTPTSTETPIPTDTPLPEPTATPTPTPTSSPTAEHSPTPEESATPTTTATPEESATPAPSDTPTLQAASSRGIGATFALEGDRREFAVNEQIWFSFDVTNPHEEEFPFGFLGVAVEKEGQNLPEFWHESWSGSQLEPQSQLVWRDKLTIGEPGEYLLYLTMCYSDKVTCQTDEGEWENIAGPIAVTIR